MDLKNPVRLTIQSVVATHPSEQQQLTNLVACDEPLRLVATATGHHVLQEVTIKRKRNEIVTRNQITGGGGKLMSRLNLFCNGRLHNHTFAYIYKSFTFLRTDLQLNIYTLSSWQHSSFTHVVMKRSEMKQI
jgi:hypothetical protein